MSDYIFLFDLDSTITKKEILPTIAEKIGLQKEMQEMTESAMRGEIPFKTSFLRRVELLRDINVSTVNKLVAEIPLNEHIQEFIKDNAERCCVVTGNLDVYVSGIIKKIGLSNRLYSSKAYVIGDKINQVISVIDKELTAKQFVQPLVVIGDGDNDTGMTKYADISIGFGGVRNIAPSLIKSIDFAFYDDYKCAEFLKSLL